MDAEPSLPKCCLAHYKGWLIFFLVPFYCMLVVAFGDHIVNRMVYINIVFVIGIIFELVPVGVTGLLPIGFYPLMNVLVSEDVCTAYFHPVIAEFILGTILLSCLEATKFTQREALIFINMFGPNVKCLHLAIVILTTILSICLPYSIAAAIMCYITKEVLANLEKLGVFQRFTAETRDEAASLQRPSKASLGFYLTIGYVATLASASTLSSTPANLVMRDMYDNQYPNSEEEVSFDKLLSYSLPPSLVNIILITFYMQIVFFGLFRSTSATGQEIALSKPEKDAALAINKEALNTMGSMDIAQCFSMTLVSVGLVLVMTRQPEFSSGWGEQIELPVLNPSPLAFCSVLMFMLPGALNFIFCWKEKSVNKTPGIVVWKVTDKVVPWELIFITGMSATIELAFKKAKANVSMGELLANLDEGGDDPQKSLMLGFLLVLILTNYICNWAVMSAMAPGLMDLAIKLKVHPLYYMLPACLTCSLSFLLPTSSMSTALAKNFLNITTYEMIKMGLIPLLIATIVAYGWIVSAGMGVYDVDEIPAWLTNFTVVYPSK